MQPILRDRFAITILAKLMKRHNEPGYSDEAAIEKAYALADVALEVRDAKEHETLMRDVK
jgi:hypothetical protein